MFYVNKEICTVEHCSNSLFRKGLCYKHNRAYAKTRVAQACAFEKCSDVSFSKWCKNHRRKGWKQDNLTNCQEEGCTRKEYRKGLCRPHAVVEDRRAGMSKRGNSWVSRGYVKVYAPDSEYSQADGTCFEHVLVMATSLGRKLFAHENIHHKNGDRLDNRLDNLELWSSSQPPGQRVEDKLKWAREIVEIYG